MNLPVSVLKRHFSGIAALATMLFASAYAAPGDIDLTFGTNGKEITRMFGAIPYVSCNCVAQQSDGKIVVAGYGGIELQDSSCRFVFTLARYTASGALDTSFGFGGVVKTPIGISQAWANGMVLLSDGKILVAGTSYNGSNSDLALVRYTASGALDQSFGNCGIVTTDLGGNDDGHCMAVQSDGKIVVAGYSSNGSDTDFAMVRYMPSGVPDPGFGNDGKVITHEDKGASIAVQSDGKIVIAGYSGTLVRYASNGMLDTSFGTGGKATFPIVDSNFGGSARMALQSDDKIMVAGYSANGSNRDFTLVRYTASGALDQGFGNGGIVTTDFGGGDDKGNSVAVQKDGKIVVAGVSDSGTRYTALACYTASGALDSSFGTGGKATTPDNGWYQNIAVQSDGKIVVAGTVFYDYWMFFTLRRYEGGIVATAPEIALSGNGTGIVNGDTTPSTTDHSDFGVTPVNNGTLVRIFTIINTGTGTLNLSGNPHVTLSGSTAFSVTSQPSSDTVAANGGTVTFTITYHPPAVGTDNATVSIASDDADGNPYTFAISGRGLAGLEAWRNQWFGTANSIGDAADAFDLDHDGLSNLFEYAFGGDPRVPDSAITCPTPTVSGGKLQIRFKCDAACTDITYTLQASTTCQSDSWTDIARSIGGAAVQPIGTFSEVSDTGTGQRTVTVTASTETFPEARGFLRIKITE